MSNNGDNNHSTDVIDSIGNKGKKGFNAARSLARNGKSIARLAKFVLSFLTKVIASLLKWLLAVLGPYVLIALVVIILVLLVLQSVSSFDLFQRDNERTEAEVVFDETLKKTFQSNIDSKAINKIDDYFSKMQSGPEYQPVSFTYINNLANAVKPSYSIPTIHYYFNTLDDVFRPWHAKYKKEDVSDKNALIAKFSKIQNKEMAYYFKKSKAYEPEIIEKAVPIEEYVQTTTSSVCVTVDEDGKEQVSRSGPNTTKKVLPKRQVADTVSMGYSEAKMSYVENKVTSNSTSSDGDCTTTTKTVTVTYVLVETMPTVVMDSAEIVRILMRDSEKGEHTKLVKAQDLETAFEIGKAADSSFPIPEIEYVKFTKCVNEDKKSLDECITGSVKQLASATWGGVTGYNGINNRGWYPAEYESLYKDVEKKTGMDWSAIAAIHGMETSFSRNPIATDRSLKSSAGARGHFQQMPLTWVGWAIRSSGLVTYTDVGDITSSNIDIIFDLNNIKKYGGKGVDGDGDGVADPWNLKDSMLATAKYIMSMGYKKGDEAAIKKALASYNGGPFLYDRPGPRKYGEEAYAMHLAFSSNSIKPIDVPPGQIMWPTVGTFTSDYGDRILPQVYGHSNPVMHWGIDVANKTGTPVVTVADGVVYKMEKPNYTTNWGLYVVIKHNINGQVYLTNYAHLDGYAPGLSVGKPVEKGDLIGYMGFTGRGSGSHLHFEVYRNTFSYGRTNINPETFLPPRKGVTIR